MTRYNSQIKKFQSTQKIGLFTLIATLSFTAVVSGQAANAVPSWDSASMPTMQVQQPAATPRLPRQVARRVVRELSQQYNVPRRNLAVIQHSRETWTDGCLGLAAPNERCTTALVEGWRVEVTNGQQNWIYRTDLTAQTLRPEIPDNTAGLLPEASDRLLQTIAQSENVPLESLSVAEAQPATWDGCMGIFEPDQACTQIAIFGWRAIVTDGNQSWVYHLDQNGDRIVQNATASGSQGGLIPTFQPLDQVDGTQGATLVFYWAESGGIAGIVTERYLTSDGTIYRQSSRLGTPTSEPQVEKRLSPEQVEQFRQVLLEQRFPNLDNMRYISSVSLADYPTITLKGLGASVDYTDLEMDNFPSALQEVIRAWEAL